LFEINLRSYATSLERISNEWLSKDENVFVKTHNCDVKE
jgi:hypothetical protein